MFERTTRFAIGATRIAIRHAPAWATGLVHFSPRKGGIMETELMREFVVFSRYLNFSKAARKLNLAQPTLSSHVQSMERELGFELVQRSKRIRLTPAGKRFCADAERLLSAYDETLELCRGIAKEKAGSLVFEKPIHQGGVDREFDMLLLMFQDRNPSIAVSKQATPEHPVREILEKGIADVAFLFNDTIELFDDDFADKVERLGVPDRQRGPFYLWAHDSHPLAQRSSVPLEELGRCRFLIPSSIRYQSLENLARIGAGITGAPVSCSYWPGSYEECIVNIRPDEVMIVNESDMHDAAYSLLENRVYVPLEGMEELLKPCFIYLKANDNPALDAFASFLAGLRDERAR